MIGKMIGNIYHEDTKDTNKVGWANCNNSTISSTNYGRLPTGQVQLVLGEDNRE